MSETNVKEGDHLTAMEVDCSREEMSSIEVESSGKVVNKGASGDASEGNTPSKDSARVNQHDPEAEKANQNEERALCDDANSKVNDDLNAVEMKNVDLATSEKENESESHESEVAKVNSADFHESEGTNENSAGTIHSEDEERETKAESPETHNVMEGGKTKTIPRRTARYARKINFARQPNFGKEVTLVHGQFEGDMIDEIRHGQGRIDWADGSYYKGSFFDGLRDGEGEYVCDGGEHTYKGEWKQSKKHGKGVETWPNGETYIGTYKYGKFHGKGVHASRRGRYDGEWADGRKNGYGRMEWKSGDIYEGQWKNGFLEGEGKYIKFSDKSIYVGEWKTGLRNGSGAQTLANGEKYTGEWKDNKKHGIGIYRFANGRWRKGEFENDQKKKWLTEERIG